MVHTESRRHTGKWDRDCVDDARDCDYDRFRESLCISVVKTIKKRWYGFVEEKNCGLDDLNLFVTRVDIVTGIVMYNFGANSNYVPASIAVFFDVDVDFCNLRSSLFPLILGFWHWNKSIPLMRICGDGTRDSTVHARRCLHSEGL